MNSLDRPQEKNDYYCEKNSGLYTKEWFFKRDIICGKSTKEFLTKIMGLKEENQIKVFWKRKYFEIVLPEFRDLIFIKKYNYKEKDFYKKFNINVQSGETIILGKYDLNKDLEKIIENIGKSLKLIPMHKLFEKVYLDRESIIRKNASRPHKNEEIEDFQEWFCIRWGGRESELLFMDQNRFNYLVKRCIKIKPKNKFCYIEHMDFECLNMNEKLNFVKYNRLLDLPNIELREIKELFDRGKTNDQDSKRRYGLSFLNDYEIIYGGGENLEKTLELKYQEDPTQEIIVGYGCVQYITGDDINNIAKKMSKKLGCNIICKDQKNGTSDNNFVDSILKEIIKVTKEEKIKIKSSINLVGFNKNKSYDELKKLLKCAGIIINKEPVPELSSSNFENYSQSEIQVLFPNKNYEKTYKELFEKIKIPTLILPAPYGFKLTNEWIDSICSKLKIDLSKNKPWIQEHKRLKKIYEGIGKEANKKRIGMVLSKYDVKRFSRQEKCFDSIPLIPLLEDMGFKLDILIYSSDREFFELKKNVEKLFVEKRKHLISHFKEDDELKDWLNKESIDCIYSDFSYDSRISRNGKNMFSLSMDIEMGYEGAIRSLNRLMNKCNYTFNKRYHSYFNEYSKPISLGGEKIAN